MTGELTAKRLIRSGGAILLSLVIAAYGLWQGRDLLFGIRTRVKGIEDGMRSGTAVLSLTGVARRAGGMRIDDRFVPVAEDGSWSDTIALLPGQNIVTIATTDRFKRTKTRIYRIYYAPDERTISS